MEHLNQLPESQKNLAVPDKVRGSTHTLSRSQYSEIPASAYAAEADDELQTRGLIAYLRILRRHRGTWIVFIFLGGLIGVLITLPQTRIYQARTSLEIIGLNDNFLNFKQTSPVAEERTNVDTSDIQTHIKIIQSESLLDRVIAKLSTRESVSAEESSRPSAWRKLLNLPELSGPTIREQVLRNAAKSLKVRAAGQTRVVEITVDSPSPKLAAAFANTLADEFIEQNLESRWKTTEKTSSWLSRQLDDMRIKLERSEDALQAYARNSGLIFTEEKTNISEEKLKQIQQELSTATADRIAKQSTYEMALNGPPDSLPNVLNDSALKETHAKITDLRRQIAQLRATYTPEFKAVKRAEAELATLQAAFDSDRAAILARIRNEYQEASRKEKLLSAAYNAQTSEVTGEGEKSIQYSILKREADSNRQLYDAMLQQLKQSTIASAMRASNLRVVDPAKVPAYPYKPNAPQGGGLGLLSGMLLGAAFIIMRERADRSIQQPGDSPLYLNLPELGIIPAGKSVGSRNTLDAAVGPGKQNTSDQIELITWQRKPSLVAESFRSTLISILFAGENGSKPKVLVLTSPSPGEGKSTVTSNLAIAMAEVGQKIVLIDADMRRPRQHEIFAINNDRGLSTILREKTPLNGDESLGGLIRESEVPGLFVLSSGPGASSSTNLLYGSHMFELLQYLRNEFDVVLIDTPPMLQIPDARVLGRIADQVIMVIHAGHTTRDAAIAARQRFSEDGTQILGTILNDWDPKQSTSGYYGRYQNYYRNYSRYYGEGRHK